MWNGNKKMRHRSKKIKFNYGKDAKDMLVRQLASNFLTRGVLVTTYKKAKVTRSEVEHLVTKAKVKSEANKNVLLRRITKDSIVTLLFDIIAPVFKLVNGGYTRIIKLQQRKTDGAQIVRLEWASPVVLPTKKITLEKTEKVVIKEKLQK